jgi:two-component system sensor histidine kinase VicK
MPDCDKKVFERMFDQSDECFLIYDIGRLQFIYANKAFANITKHKVEELLAAPASMTGLIHPDDQETALKIFKQLLRKRSSTFLDFRIVLADGNERWVRMKVYPIAGEEKIEYLAAMLEDDTARKTSILNMQKITGWKDSLLEILAHDLRGPIGIIKMLSSAIDRQLTGQEQESILKWTKIIRDICEKNLELIRGLIEKETLQASGMQLNKERIDLVWETSEIMKVYSDSRDKQIRFTSSHENIFAVADSMKFLQILNNLVSNAIKFTEKDGRIDVHLEKLDTSVLVTVSDNGIGIPRQLQPVLFNKYTHASRNGVDGQETVGLGMWIVKLLTEAHGGRVWFETTENIGTKFYVEIPLGETEEEPQEEAASKKTAKA